MLIVELPQQRAADVADADDDQRQRLARFEERLMDGVERADLVRRVDDARDVALRRALGDRADVDVVAAERPEHLAGDARASLHPLADDGEDHLPGLFVDRGQPVVELEPELVVDRLHRRRGVGVCTAKQIVCSDDACEIRMTLTWRAASARNSRSAIPGHADHRRVRGS